MKKIFALLLAASPLLAFAQNPPHTIPNTLQSGAYSLLDIFQIIANWLFTFLLILAVIFILFAAYKYLFSQGGDSVKDAHRILIYAAVAVAVGVLAQGIVFAVKNIVEHPTASTSTPLNSSPNEDSGRFSGTGGAS